MNAILSLPKGSQLLFTGHSAGGAVAALIFAHVLLKSTQNGSPCPEELPPIPCSFHL
jgi:hypothetical protein